MSEKVINRLLITVAILVVVYGLALFWQNRQTAPGITMAINTAYLKADADRLDIRTNGAKVTLERRGNKWFVGKKQVGDIKISTLLKALEKVVFIRVASSDAKDLSVYGIDEKKSNRLKIYKDKKPLKVLLFGNMAANDSFYVKMSGDHSVYEAQGDLIFEVGQPASDWAASPSRKTKKK